MSHEVVGGAAAVDASTDILANEPTGLEQAAAAANTVVEPVVETVNTVIEPEKPKAEKKKKAKKKAAKAKKKVAVKKTGKKKTGETRGRPPVFVGAVKTEIVRLIRKHGITGTQKILAAKKGDLVALRKADVITKATKISLPTLVKFGQEAGVELKRGRRAAA